MILKCVQMILHVSDEAALVLQHEEVAVQQALQAQAHEALQVRLRRPTDDQQMAPQALVHLQHEEQAEARVDEGGLSIQVSLVGVRHEEELFLHSISRQRILH